MNYNEDILYKLWLNLMCGHNPMLINKNIEAYGSAEEIFKSDDLYKKFLSGMKLPYRLKARRSLDDARQLLEYCGDNDISVISIGDKGYPARLKEVYAPPQILYVKGELPDFDKLVCVSIVGSRDCSDDVREFTYTLSKDLAKAGILVISGMALGIDAAAHTGALDAGSVTAAVLAGGADVIYPKSHKKLYSEITKNGAIISERPPGTIGRGSFYREKNRIIAGLANGVVIAEGKLSSGTKLTANWAISSNRDLFAVPGKPKDKGAELPNNLIKNSAKLITSAEDIIEEYISVYPLELKYGIDLINEERQRNDTDRTTISDDKLSGLQPVPKPDFESFEGNQRIILEYLYKTKTTIHIDEISRDCGIDVTELSFLIIQLLMSGVIKEHPGEYYSIT